MTGRFIIVSSDPEFTSLLLAAVPASGIRSESLLFDRYPTAAQLRRLVRRSVDLLRYSFPG